MSNEKIILEPNEDGVYVYSHSESQDAPRQKPPAKGLFKSIRRAIISVCVLAAIFLLILMFVKGGVWMSQKLYPSLSSISKVAMICIIVVFVPLAAFQRTQAIAGLGILASSYVFGLTLWIWSLLLTYNLWGIFAVILGLFFVGIGIVPMALLAVLFKGQWSTFGELLLLMIFIPVSRSFGLYLTARAAQLRNSAQHF